MRRTMVTAVQRIRVFGLSYHLGLPGLGLGTWLFSGPWLFDVESFNPSLHHSITPSLHSS